MAKAATKRMRPKKAAKKEPYKRTRTAGIPQIDAGNEIAQKNLKRLRVNAGLSLGQLSELTGLTKSAIQKHEIGRAVINAGQLQWYAEHLQVGLGRFFEPED